MPSAAEHQAKYAANRCHLVTGNGGAPLATADGGWAAVVAFYAALHLADRLAARINYHPHRPGAHGKRLRFLGTHHRPILADYNELKTASEIARYGTLNQFRRAYPEGVIQTVLIDRSLAAIEAHVTNVFNLPGGAAGKAES